MNPLPSTPALINAQVIKLNVLSFFSITFFLFEIEPIILLFSNVGWFVIHRYVMHDLLYYAIIFKLGKKKLLSVVPALAYMISCVFCE